jgi:DNA replication protein DnaC
METIAGKQWDDRTAPVYFANVPRLLDDLRSAFKDPQEMERLDHAMMTSDLVIFDDLGAENATEWAKDKLYQYIDYRYANCLASVFTSNQDLDNIDLRIADRIKGTCTQVEFIMSSKRQFTAKGAK